MVTLSVIERIGCLRNSGDTKFHMFSAISHVAQNSAELRIVYSEFRGIPAESVTIGVTYRLINNIDTKPKCRHLKKFTCKETLWQIFIRVYKLDISSVMLVLLTQLCELLPL
jgi:hypothetical protein